MNNRQINIFLISSGKICFRPDDGCLWNEEEPEKVLRLTSLPSRVLEHLLSSAGRVVTREELLDKVWESAGLQPSGTSLTQYISQIRRTLAELGADNDVIITLPRAGFLINDDNVECRQVTVENSQNHIHLPDKGRPFSFVLIFILSLVTLLSLFFFFASDIEEHGNVPEVITYASHSAGNCKVHYLQRKQDEYKEFFTEKLKNLGPCSKDAEFLVSADMEAVKSGHGRLLMAKCETDHKITGGILYGCTSIYDYQN